MSVPEILKMNIQLLPIKLHYFLFWCGIGSSVIFIPLVAKNVGLTASFIGVLWMIIALSTLFCQPIFGAISDCIQNTKAVLMVSVFTVAITLYSLIHIPPIKTNSVRHISINCSGSKFYVESRSNYNSTCLNAMLKREGYCSFLRQQEHHLSEEMYSSCNDKKLLLRSYSSSKRGNENNSSPCVKYSLRDCTNDLLYWTSCDPSISSCFWQEEEQEVSIYTTYQLWLFSALMVISQAMMYTCFSLSDAMCYEILGTGNNQYFGNQRLWSTVSYGLASFSAGYLNDLESAKQGAANYTIGFYIMLGAMFLDLIALYKMEAIEVRIARFSFKCIGRVLVSTEIIIFVVGAFLNGMLTAILWNYQFWFLESLGASQTLLGLTSLMQSLVANTLFFAISGKILRTFGHFSSLIISLLAYAVRYILYFVLKDPWHMLPVEILDGVTFSLFYVTITGFAKANAPSGMEATMVGLLVAVFEGLGIALGSLLAGVGFDYFGGRYTFLVAGAGSAVSAIVLSLFKLAAKKINSVPHKDETEDFNYNTRIN